MNLAGKKKSYIKTKKEKQNNGADFVECCLV